MKSFYSLIKIAPNEMSGDTLTIGILLSTSSGIKVKFSKYKKQIAKSLISADSSILDFVEKEILAKVKEHNNFLSENKKGLFEWSTILDANYFSYLSKYSNGLLKFSAPTIIADNIDDVKFEKLVRLFVDGTFIPEEDKKPAKKIEKIFYETVEKRLISKVKDKVHIHQQIDSKIVPSLFNPFEIDCIGLNGVLVGAKALPFTQSKETLHKSVNTYISVIAQLSAKYKKSLDENKFYLIADQPDKKSPEYQLWKQLFSTEKLLKVISSDESGQVADLIENNKASKFL